MLETLREKLQRRRELSEIDALNPAELDDIGLSRSELRDLVQTDGAVIERQMDMAFRHGVTERVFSVARHDYALIVQRCRDCGATAECGRFLADRDAPAELSSGFCPNAETYRELAGSRD